MSKEISHVKRIFHYLPLFLLPAFSIPLAHAQYGFDIGVGFGAMQDKASSKNLDDSLAPCTIGSAEPTFLAPKKPKKRKSVV